jgi:hypothetical protein
MYDEEIFRPNYGMLEVLHQEATRLLQWDKPQDGTPLFTMIVPRAVMAHLLRDSQIRGEMFSMATGSDKANVAEIIRRRAPIQVAGFEIHAQDHVGGKVYTDYAGQSHTLSSENGPGKLAPLCNLDNADSVYYGYRNADFTPRYMGDPEVNSSATEDDGNKPWLSRYIGWIFTNRAVFGLEGKPPRIERELRNYNTKKTGAIIGCNGWTRGDWKAYLAGTIDTYAEASACYNFSSMPFGCVAQPINAIS